MTLDQLGPDESAKVITLGCEGPLRRRLMDLGILPGTTIRLSLTSPLGDPKAYVVRGSVIALRKAQASSVEIEPLGPGKSRR